MLGAEVRLTDDIELLMRAVQEAGVIAADHFRKGVQHWMKDGDAPVSEADMAVNRFLSEVLPAARPDYGWLSEESENDASRLERQRVFIVDPIDGTRGFIKGSDEWTICIAVAEGGRVTTGVVHNPLKGETFSAIAGGGAWCNGNRLQVSAAQRIAGARIAAAKRAVEPLGPVADTMQRAYIPSLAYRFALVARGDYDATMSAGSAHEWDVAAAGLLVEEAGGIVTHPDGKPPVYNKAKPLIAPLIAAGAPLHAALRETIASASKQI